MGELLRNGADAGAAGGAAGGATTSSLTKELTELKGLHDAGANVAAAATRGAGAHVG